MAITGPNGSGKTNLLDAIHYLSFTRSYFSAADGNQVLHGEQGFRIEGGFRIQDLPSTVSVVLRESGKKEIQCDGVLYEKFSKHIGKYPCVMIAPDDTELISGGSELRRKFADTLLSQLDADYLLHLISYNKVLAQRNSYLKQCAQTQSRNPSLLEVLDTQLATAGTQLYQRRAEFLPAFGERVLHFYKVIAGKDEQTKLRYLSHLHQQPLELLLEQSRDKDYLLQRTSAGVHKDELELLLGEDLFKSTASQGQRKSLLFALKLAEAETLKLHKQFAPLLLLDDVFEKLDGERMHNLLGFVCHELGAQVFLTDTDSRRVQSILEQTGTKPQLLVSG